MTDKPLSDEELKELGILIGALGFGLAVDKERIAVLAARAFKELQNWRREMGGPFGPVETPKDIRRFGVSSSIPRVEYPLPPPDWNPPADDTDND